MPSAPSARHSLFTGRLPGISRRARAGPKYTHWYLQRPSPASPVPHRALAPSRGGVLIFASRLSDVAQPGETLIGSALRRALAGRIDAEEARDAELKDVGHTTRPWRVKGFRGSGALEQMPFVGLRTELIQIDGVIGSCRDTGRGMTIYVRGEAGIGKTRLIERFMTAAAREGFSCHRGLVFRFRDTTRRRSRTCGRERRSPDRRRSFRSHRKRGQPRHRRRPGRRGAASVTQ